MEDFKSCFRFYRDKLELPVRYGHEDSIYAEFKAEVLHIALFQRQFMAVALGTEKRPPQAEVQDGQVLILRVDDVDTAYASLQDKGVCFETQPLDRLDWNCRTAHFRDPDGNLWELNADLLSG